jgi:hypothetical protein
MVVLITSSGWGIVSYLDSLLEYRVWRTCPNDVTSNKFNPAPSNRLLNLTGFFSSLGAEAVDGIAVDILG